MFRRGRLLSQWKPWNPIFGKEALFIREKLQVPIIPQSESINILLKQLGNETGFYLAGAPGCGKSSLALELQAKLKEDPKYAVLVITEHTPVSSIRSTHERLPKTKTLVVIIDEFQSRLAKSKELRQVMDSTFKSDVRYACFGTTVSTGTVGHDWTPAELRRHKLWMRAPTLNRTMIRDYASEVLRFHGASQAEAGKLSDQVFDFSCGSLNVMVYVLRSIVESKGRFPTYDQILEDSSNAPRVVVNGEADWTEDSEQGKRLLCKNLLTVGEVPMNEACPEIRTLVRRGFVAPVLARSSSEPIFATGWGNLFSWAHPWQPLYAMHEKHKHLIVPGKTEAATPSADLDNILRSAVSTVVYITSFMIMETAISTSVLKENETHEYAIQSVFSLAFNKATGRHLKNEVTAKVQGELHRKRLDFVFADDLKKCRLGFELMRDGKDNISKVREHLERFSDLSAHRYTTLNELTDHLVVNFERVPVAASNVPDHLKNKRLLTISPDPASGWGQLVLDYAGARTKVPRDFLPRCIDWSQTPVVPTMATKSSYPLSYVLDEFWVSVTLPNKKVAARDITLAVKKGEVSSNVDGLKEAVLKKFPNKLQGKGMSHLTVYPPGLKKDGKALDVGDALKRASRWEPYHVEVE